MNLIKLKDILLPSTYDNSDYYNENLKGRYAYWVKMTYIVPFDSIDYNQYIKLEKSNDMLNYIKSDDIIDYIDMTETNNVNNISEFILKNKSVTDSLITLSEIKRFRYWLASSLLEIKSDFDDMTKHMLEFYKNDMYDSVIKYLDMFGGVDVSLSYESENVCGCCSGVTINELTTSLSNCNTINIYKNDIYQYMLGVFGDYGFWNQFSKEFLKTFKLYIDNIIKVGLPMIKGINNDIYRDCVCGVKEDNTNNIILSRLSNALGYIINDDIDGHKNYISDAFKDWSVIYPMMNWQ